MNTTGPGFSVTPAIDLSADWHIERDNKLFFRVVRNGEEGAEYVRSASGRVSSFKTYDAAKRAVKRAEAA